MSPSSLKSKSVGGKKQSLSPSDLFHNRAHLENQSVCTDSNKAAAAQGRSARPLAGPARLPDSSVLQRTVEKALLYHEVW